MKNVWYITTNIVLKLADVYKGNCRLLRHLKVTSVAENTQLVCKGKYC